MSTWLAPETIETGDAAQALGWIASAPPPVRLPLKYFIRGFDGQQFYRYPGGHPRFRVVESLLPAWFQPQMAMLAGVVPAPGTQLTFEGFPMTAVPWAESRQWFSWLPPPQPGLPMCSPARGQLIMVAIADSGLLALCVAERGSESGVIFAVRLEDTDSISVPDANVTYAFHTFDAMLQLACGVRARGGDPIVAHAR